VARVGLRIAGLVVPGAGGMGLILLSIPSPQKQTLSSRSYAACNSGQRSKVASSGGDACH